MTHKILAAYENYLRLEGLSEIHEKLKPAMRAAEAEVIRLVSDRGGSVNLGAIGRDLTLAVHHVEIEGKHFASYIRAHGTDHPAIVRTADIHAVGHRVAWKRQVNVVDLSAVVAAARKKVERVS